MEKIWHIDIEGNREGPYSIEDLRRDVRITPDTLVWKKGFSLWVPIRNVPELKEVFADEVEHKDSEEPDETKGGGIASTEVSDQLTIAIREDPPYFFLWILMAAILVSYLFYQLYWFR